MTRHLPQLEGGVFLTEAGLETDLVFLHGIDLPCFASFPLLDDLAGRSTLYRYYERFLAIARRDGTGVVFETPTWRASADWGAQLGYDTAALDRVNRHAVALLRELGRQHPDVTQVVSGNLGPRGDGYVATDLMTAAEAARYHAPQIRSLTEAGADMVAVLTLTYVAEAVGIVRAAVEAEVPVAVSFTVETDGRLPDGTPLAAAITATDEATDGAAAYHMVNCAHPGHFAHLFDGPGPWHRVRAVRANASTLSHAQLDEATELDRGDPDDLADRYAELRRLLPELAVVGGCCGTDLAHIDAISAALATTTTGAKP
jgi:S-methylmethionine-dependent homocysteine/selenocysteine methylase